MSTSSNLCITCETEELFTDVKLAELCRTGTVAEVTTYLDEHGLNCTCTGADCDSTWLDALYFGAKYNRLDVLDAALEWTGDTCDFNDPPEVAYREGHFEALKVVLPACYSAADELRTRARAEREFIDPRIFAYLEYEYSGPGCRRPKLTRSQSHA